MLCQRAGSKSAAAPRTAPPEPAIQHPSRGAASLSGVMGADGFNAILAAASGQRSLSASNNETADAGAAACASAPVPLHPSPRAASGEEDTKKGGAQHAAPRHPPPPSAPLACARCGSEDTKFCYYNNYNIKQPRFYCKVRGRHGRARGIAELCFAGASGRSRFASAAASAAPLFGRCGGPGRGAALPRRRARAHRASEAGLLPLWLARPPRARRVAPRGSRRMLCVMARQAAAERACDRSGRAAARKRLRMLVAAGKLPPAP